jgi:hypothetical protein
MSVCPMAAIGAEEHRQHRQEGHDLLPVAHRAAEGVMHDAGEQRHGRHLGRGREEGAVIGVGEPS